MNKSPAPVATDATGAPIKERTIGVVGAGTMGAGIAQCAAQRGFTVQTLDAQPDAVRRAHDAIRERLDKQVAKGSLPPHEREEAVARLRIAQGREAFREAELVIEAVPEEAGLKKKILADLDAELSPGVTLASNTSSLSIGALAQGLRHPNRFLGMHFFNPAPVMKLVELIWGPQTDNQTRVMGVSFANAFGKTPVKVKDSPGFVVNRVARPFYLESLAMLEAGWADVAAIDTAMRTVGGFRMGPFELLDLIGLDVNLSVTRTVYEGFNQPRRFAPNGIQARLVEQNRLGRKTGRGFYDHSGPQPTPAYETQGRPPAHWKPSAAFTAFAEVIEKPASFQTYLFARIVTAIVNEAALAGETIALPREVDLGMKLGLNFPSGPLEFADYVGLDIVHAFMRELHADDPAHRFDPAPLLLKHIEADELGEKSAQGFLRHSL